MSKMISDKGGFWKKGFEEYLNKEIYKIFAMDKNINVFEQI